MAKVLRLTEQDLCNMIQESILRTLNEGDFLNALNLKGLAKYAKSRIWDGHGSHEIGKKPKEQENDEEMKAAFDAGASGEHGSFEKWKENKERQQNK